MEQAFQKYEKEYLMRRNDIMFIFKFIAPYVFGLFEIKANHGISMFIMSKKAFLDMREFYQAVAKRQNVFKLTKFWEEYTASSKYKSIETQIKADIDIVESQCLSYSF